MLRIGINGFGRIGRAFLRLNLKYYEYEIVAINDIDSDIHNLAYLLKYDTTYGKLHNHKIDVAENSLYVDSKPIKVFCESNITNVPWEREGVDIVVDSSGVFQNVLEARQLIDKGIKKVIITHSPKNGVDFTFIDGVTDEGYLIDEHHIVSSSICDANAVAPFFKAVNDRFPIEMGEVTTLHPWLSYQNLVDGTLRSVSSPGHTWSDYALGRSSIGSLIPKETTLVSALEKVLPGIANIVNSMSFRTPTAIVSVAEGAFILQESTELNQVLGVLRSYSERYKGTLKLDERSLVSIDYLQEEYGAVVDLRWLKLHKNRMLKFVLWYDNEWGYTYRVYCLIDKLLKL